MDELRSRPLFTLNITLHPTLDMGATPAGHRRVIAVSGGDFEGDRLRGEVVAEGGSDHLLERADGSFQQDVRMTLRTHDGAIILMTYRGVRHCSPDVAARLSRGEHVAKSEYYLRTVPFFETADPHYAWINKIVSVGTGGRTAAGVTYELHEIL